MPKPKLDSSEPSAGAAGEGAPPSPAMIDPGALAEIAAAESGADLGGAPGAPAAAPAAVDYKQDVREVIDFALALFVPMLPSLQVVWTPATCDRLATVWAPVFAKYGWDLRAFPELMAAAASVPVLLMSWKAAQHDIAQLKARAAEQEQAKPKAPDASGAAG